MPTPRKVSGLAGSYLLQQQQLKEARSSPTNSPPASAFGDHTGLRFEVQRLQQKYGALKQRQAGAGMDASSASRMMAADATTDCAVLVTALPGTGQQARNGALPLEALSPQEVEEAALRCHWLAHYWELAEQLGICPEVASERAEYWRTHAPSEEAFFAIVHGTVSSVPQLSSAVHEDLSQRTSTASVSNTAAEPAQLQVTAADIMEVERGMRQVAELSIVHSVGCSLAWAAEARTRQQATQFLNGIAPDLSAKLLQESPDPEDPSLPEPLDQPEQPADSLPFSMPMSALDRREMRFQAAWLAYMWARAAMAGVEAHQALSKAELWSRYLERAKYCERHWSELATAQREVQLLGVEQQLWRKRS